MSPTGLLLLLLLLLLKRNFPKKPVPYFLFIPVITMHMKWRIFTQSPFHALTLT